jgi:plasmid stabilization system protein ParE
MTYFTLGFLLAAVPLLIVIHLLMRLVSKAQARVEDIEDRMLVLAEKPHALPVHDEVPGKVRFIDERREVELDETRP